MATRASYLGSRVRGIVLGSGLGGNFFLGSLRWELLALSAREVGPIYTLQGR